MKKQFLLTTILCLGSVFAPDAGAEGLKTLDGRANFSEFNYTGSDKFYRENQLSSESEFFNPILPGWYSDPALCTNGEGDYYLTTSTFSYFPGVLYIP